VRRRGSNLRGCNPGARRKDTRLGCSERPVLGGLRRLGSGGGRRRTESRPGTRCLGLPGLYSAGGAAQLARRDPGRRRPAAPSREFPFNPGPVAAVSGAPAGARAQAGEHGRRLAAASHACSMLRHVAGQVMSRPTTDRLHPLRAPAMVCRTWTTSCWARSPRLRRECGDGSADDASRLVSRVRAGGWASVGP
jgi:hypothetical protein